MTIPGPCSGPAKAIVRRHNGALRRLWHDPLCALGGLSTCAFLERGCLDSRGA